MQNQIYQVVVTESYSSTYTGNIFVNATDKQQACELVRNYCKNENKKCGFEYYWVDTISEDKTSIIETIN